MNEKTWIRKNNSALEPSLISIPHIIYLKLCEAFTFKKKTAARLRKARILHNFPRESHLTKLRSEIPR